jgi:hypothetical protein
MDSSLQQLEGDLTWLLAFKGQIDYEIFGTGIRNVFYKLHISRSRPRLIVDLRNTVFPADADAQMTLDVFIEELASVNFTTPIYYAILSENRVLSDYANVLEAEGLELPIARSEADARTLFNLKIGYENLKQVRDNISTQDVRGIEQLSLHLSSETTRPLKRGTSRFPSGGLVKLAAVDSTDTLLISLQSEIVLGRRSSEGTQPDVDLSLWGAFQNGVSRRHAKILINSDEQLCIVELGSTNGTFVNTVQLELFQLYILHEFDTVRLGNLSMRITFEDTMKS